MQEETEASDHESAQEGEEKEGKRQEENESVQEESEASGDESAQEGEEKQGKQEEETEGAQEEKDTSDDESAQEAEERMASHEEQEKKDEKTQAKEPPKSARKLKRSASTDVNFTQKPGRAVSAELTNVALSRAQAAVLKEVGQPVPDPAEQLAILRAERLTERPGLW